MPSPPRAAMSNASRCISGGWPASDPARSKPTTPWSCIRTECSAIATERSGSNWRSEQLMIRETTPNSRRAAFQAAPFGGDGIVHGKTAPGAEERAVAHLEVAEAIGRGVGDHLVGHPLDGVGFLQQRDGVVEPGQIVVEVAGVGNEHPAAQTLGGVGRQRHAGRAGASSSMVAGRSAPSRWTWSSALGSRRKRSAIGRVRAGPGRSEDAQDGTSSERGRKPPPPGHGHRSPAPGRRRRRRPGPGRAGSTRSETVAPAGIRTRRAFRKTGISVCHASKYPVTSIIPATPCRLRGTPGPSSIRPNSGPGAGCDPSRSGRRRRS